LSEWNDETLPHGRRIVFLFFPVDEKNPILIYLQNWKFLKASETYIQRKFPMTYDIYPELLHSCLLVYSCTYTGTDLIFFPNFSSFCCTCKSKECFRVLTVRLAKLFDWGCPEELCKCTTLNARTFANSCTNSSAVNCVLIRNYYLWRTISWKGVIDGVNIYSCCRNSGESFSIKSGVAINGDKYLVFVDRTSEIHVDSFPWWLRF